MRREEEELQRALEESAKMADPLRGYQPSRPPATNGGDHGGYTNRKALPQQPNGRPASPVEQGFVPPASSSVITDPRQQQGRDSTEPRLRSPTSRTPQRVRALYDFEAGQSPDELPFQKGDVIRVSECVYADWWRGELRGRTGIFPANRVVRRLPIFTFPFDRSRYSPRHPFCTGGDPRTRSRQRRAGSRDGGRALRPVGDDRQAAYDDAERERSRGGSGR
jgi:hypothetical protein